MEVFEKAKTVRLKSHHDKYLVADRNEESVIQDRRHRDSKAAKWTVEFVEGAHFVIRLKSCFGRYLTAADEQHLLGVTGRRVLQTMPKKLDSKIEWEPVREGNLVKLKTRYGNFLRANAGIPPWRNSITHDIPHRHKDWIFWEVEVLEFRQQEPEKVPRSADADDDDLTTFNLTSSTVSAPSSAEGRLIYYAVGDEKGRVDDSVEWPSFYFKGHSLEELSEKLEEETGLEDIIVCTRNPLNHSISPLRLALPPNNSTMHLLLLPSTSQAAREFLPESSSTAD
ncbi:PREDICTED: uncharacterized protein LOC109178199 [Ipomoea nil]|uniref:uncharacterized protein LOC109178199 n=1 Tax=Ipomoea nil TaxID=35883 RepID=UPI0009013107|nr:PREDICTED: uncharacterized protein LOC109178199 [Ipomoea nil]